MIWDEDGDLINVVSALWWIHLHGKLGRYRLQRILDLSEGSARAFLKKLGMKGLIKTERFRGCKLTQKGAEELNRLLSDLSIVKIATSPLPGFPLEKKSFLFHLRGLAENIDYGLEQRDAAVKQGSEGAITYLYAHGELLLPIGRNLLERQPESLKAFLLDRFDLKDGDILIFCFAEVDGGAFKGGLAASLASHREKREGSQPPRSQARLADITDAEIKKIRRLERELNLLLVAYQQ